MSIFVITFTLDRLRCGNGIHVGSRNATKFSPQAHMPGSFLHQKVRRRAQKHGPKRLCASFENAYRTLTFSAKWFHSPISPR
jgi:hypothetical protein